MQDVKTLLLCIAMTAALSVCSGKQANRKKKETGRNYAVEHTIDSIIGCSINIPYDFTATKQGINFVWTSNNSATKMQNICIYSYSGLSLEPATAIRMRDSIMAVNIPGEEPQMRMRTERHRIKPKYKKAVINGFTGLMVHGQWQMEGDAMGGPFSCIALPDSARQRTVVAEAFVYAPGENKDDVMKRLTSVITTLRIKQD